MTSNSFASSTTSPFVAIPHSARLGLIIVCFGLMAGIGFKDLMGHAPISTLKWVSLALQGNLLLLVLPLLLYRPTWGWFHPLIFTLFWALLDHLRQFSVYFDGLPQHVALPTWSSEQLTMLVAYELLLNALGLVMYYLGFILMPKRGIPHLRLSHPSALRPKLLATVAFTLVVFAGYMATRGGIMAHIQSWETGRQSALAGQFYWQLLLKVGLVACLLWLGCDRKAHRQPIFWCSALLILLATFLVSGSRSALIYTIIYGVMVWALRERKLSLSKIGLTIVLGIFLMGLLGSFRNSTFSGDIGFTSTGTESTNFSAGLTEISDRSSVGKGSIPILARVPHEVGYLYGQSYVALVTVAVPRALWPAKPGMVGGQVGETFFGSSVAVPPGPIGESYWNFGVAGVILVFFCYGAFHRWLATCLETYAPQPAAFVLYSFTLFLVRPTSADLLAWLLLLVPTMILLRLFGIWGSDSPAALAEGS